MTTTEVAKWQAARDKRYRKLERLTSTPQARARRAEQELAIEHLPTIQPPEPYDHPTEDGP